MPIIANSSAASGELRAAIEKLPRLNMKRSEWLDDDYYVPLKGVLATLASSEQAAPRKEYQHFAHCNGNRQIPAGEPGHSCCCFNGRMVPAEQAAPSALAEALYKDMCPHCAGLTEYPELHSGRYHTRPGIDPGYENERCLAASLRERIIALERSGLPGKGT